MRHSAAPSLRLDDTSSGFCLIFSQIRQAGKSARPLTRLAALHIETEMHDVAVLHDVFRAFEPHLAGILGALLTAAGDEIVIGDRLSADEAFLEIGVDGAGALRRLAALGYRPGSGFLRSDREERDEAQQRVARPDDPGEAGLGESQGFEELALL